MLSYYCVIYTPVLNIFIFFRLYNIQRSIKELSEESMILHNKILAGEFPEEKSQIRENSPFLRKLLKQTKPVRVPLEEILAVKKSIEEKKFRVQLLQEQKSHKLNELKKLTSYRNQLRKSNEEESNFRFSQFLVFYVYLFS